MVEEIVFENKLLALIIRANFESDGIKFFTPDNFSQQLGYMKRPMGYKIPPHIHNKVNRNVELTQEVLFIKKGKIKINFYDPMKNYLESKIVSNNDIVLLAQGGHGFEMLEESEIFEVKQGPYCGDQDKTRF